LVIGVSVWSVVEVAKLHLDHTPRWPPEITPLTAHKLHHVRGRYRKKKKETATGRKATISTREQFGLGKEVKASDYYNEVLATFPFIKTMHLRVFDLMYQESEIIGQTMLKLISQYDIPTFPVHDCLMCRVDDVHLVLEALVATTTELLGAPISLDVTYPDRPTEYYKAVGTELVQCDKDGEVRWNKFTWGLQDDEDFDVIES
jgi:hypothetical protein